MSVCLSVCLCDAIPQPSLSPLLYHHNPLNAFTFLGPENRTLAFICVTTLHLGLSAAQLVSDRDLRMLTPANQTWVVGRVDTSCSELTLL